MKAPEHQLLSPRLQRRAYASIYEGARVLAVGVFFLPLLFVQMYLVPALVSLARQANAYSIEKAPPTLLMFNPNAQASYLTFLSTLPLLWQIAYPAVLVIGMIFLNALLVGGAAQIDKGFRQLRRLGMPGTGLSGVASKILLTGDVSMALLAISFFTLIVPNNLQESPISITVLNVMDLALALVAIGLLLTGAALWSCGSACGHGKVKEGGMAIVVSMAIFLLSWLVSAALSYLPAPTASRPELAALLYLSSMLPVNSIVSFALAFAGATKVSDQARELMRGTAE